MLELLDNIFKQNEFYEMEKIIDKKLVKKVYINRFDEMYTIMETELNEKTLNELIAISQEIYVANEIEKAKKSNWFMVLVIKQKDYISNEQNHIDAQQRKWILDIEENQYYCRKYVLWYAEKEWDILQDMLNKNYNIGNISQTLQNYKYFCEFKNCGNIGYELLTRICIKIPFLNLSDLGQMNESIEEILKEKVNVLAEGLFDLLVEKSSVNTLLECIQLDKRDNEAIEKEIEKLGCVVDE